MNAMGYMSIELYAADDNGVWRDIFHSYALTWFGESDGRIAKVRITPDDDGTYWAAIIATPIRPKLQIDTSPYVFKTREEVEVCSTDFDGFRQKIADGWVTMTRVRVDFIEWFDVNVVSAAC